MSVGMTSVMNKSRTTVMPKLVRTRQVCWPLSSRAVNGSAAVGVLHCDHQSATLTKSARRWGLAQDVGGRARVPRVLRVLLTRTQ